MLLVGEYDQAGNLIQELVWLNDIPVATIRTDQSGGSVGVFYIHTDHLNAPAKITRPSDNQIIWRWDHDPYGNGVPNEDPDGNGLMLVFNLAYPGQYRDKETGLLYNYFRDYDPSTGRYIESDPIGLKGGVNTYSYANDNPVSRIDPFGENTIVLGAEIGTFVEPGGGTAVGATIGGIFMAGAIIYEACKDKACAACTPYAKGTIGYIGPHTDHDHFPIGRPHLNLFVVNQNPSTCKCFWNKAVPDAVAPPPQVGWVDLNIGFPPLSP